MGRRKHWRVDWHHRVPDFKLVYCGPKKEIVKKEVHGRRRVLVSETVDGNENIDDRLRQQKKRE